VKCTQSLAHKILKNNAKPCNRYWKKTSEKPTKMGWWWGLFGVQLTHFVVGVCEHIISLLLNNTDSFTTHFLYLHRDNLYAAPNSTHKTRENPCLIYLSKIHFLFFFSSSKSYYHFSLSCHPLSSSLMRRLHTWVAIGKPSSSSLLLLLLLK